MTHYCRLFLVFFHTIFIPMAHGYSLLFLDTGYQEASAYTEFFQTCKSNDISITFRGVYDLVDEQSFEDFSDYDGAFIAFDHAFLNAANTHTPIHNYIENSIKAGLAKEHFILLCGLPTHTSENKKQDPLLFTSLLTMFRNNDTRGATLSRTIEKMIRALYTQQGVGIPEEKNGFSWLTYTTVHPKFSKQWGYATKSEFGESGTVVCLDRRLITALGMSNTRETQQLTTLQHDDDIFEQQQGLCQFLTSFWQQSGTTEDEIKKDVDPDEPQQKEKESGIADVVYWTGTHITQTSPKKLIAQIKKTSRTSSVIVDIAPFFTNNESYQKQLAAVCIELHKELHEEGISKPELLGALPLFLHQITSDDVTRQYDLFGSLHNHAALLDRMVWKNTYLDPLDTVIERWKELCPEMPLKGIVWVIPQVSPEYAIFSRDTLVAPQALHPLFATQTGTELEKLTDTKNLCLSLHREKLGVSYYFFLRNQATELGAKIAEKILSSIPGSRIGLISNALYPSWCTEGLLRGIARYTAIEFFTANKAVMRHAEKLTALGITTKVIDLSGN